MKISKKDALLWFEFFASLPEDEELLPRQQEIALATFAQIEAAVDARNEKLMRDIPGLKTLGGRIVKVEDYKIPTCEVVHRLVLIEKVSPTPRAYPRAFAKIKKAPL